MSKERYQNPVGGDTVILRQFIYNSNNKADPHHITKVEIYVLDKTNITDDNPDGRCLLRTFESVERDCLGEYHVELYLDPEIYPIGRYLDVWTLGLNSTSETSIENCFQVYSSLWYTTPIPIVYDFSFHFQPNKLRKGSKQYLMVEITPNVPRATDLQRYYENLAIVSDLRISMEKACDSCSFSDLNLIIDNEMVNFREKRFGFYFLDTENMDCGLYNLWFNLCIGSNTYISPKEQLQIYS